MIYLGLLAGFLILLFSGDFLVRGAAALAIRLGVPAMIIGLTVVAFGTSAPELFVSVRAILGGSPGIAVGNIVGSNIANVLLVLGIPALICATDCDQPFIKRNTFYVIAATGLFIILCFNGPLVFWHGALLFGLIILFLIASVKCGAAGDMTSVDDEAFEQLDGVSGFPTSKTFIMLFLGLGIIGLPIGAELIVTNGVDIARSFGIAQAAIGLTLIALGTSLPELATTVAAALRGHSGLALGNVLGSNIFNILAVMGVTALLAPIDIPPQFLKFDLWIMLAASFAIVPFVLTRRAITKIPALLFISAYAAYIYLVFFNNFETTKTVSQLQVL